MRQSRTRKVIHFSQSGSCPDWREVLQIGLKGRSKPQHPSSAPSIYEGSSNLNYVGIVSGTLVVTLPGIDLASCFYLGGRQAIRTIGDFALQHLGVKVAALRVFQNAVFHSVKGVAGVQHRFMERSVCFSLGM